MVLLSVVQAQDHATSQKEAPTLFVAPLDGDISQIIGWQPALGEGLAEMLITEMSRGGAFQVLESTALRDLGDEIKLGEEGYVGKDEKVEKGGWAGAGQGDDVPAAGRLQRLDLRPVRRRGDPPVHVPQHLHLGLLRQVPDHPLVRQTIEDCLTDMISPVAFGELNVTYVRRLIEEIRSAGMKSVYYFCGNPAGKWDLLLSLDMVGIGASSGSAW